MKQTFSLLKSIGCVFKGHQYVVTHVVNERVQEYCCTGCKKKITNDIYGNLQPLDALSERINKALNELAIKKNRRSIAA